MTYERLDIITDIITCINSEGINRDTLFTDDEKKNMLDFMYFLLKDKC